MTCRSPWRRSHRGRRGPFWIRHDGRVVRHARSGVARYGCARQGIRRFVGRSPNGVGLEMSRSQFLCDCTAECDRSQSAGCRLGISNLRRWRGSVRHLLTLRVPVNYRVSTSEMRCATTYVRSIRNGCTNQVSHRRERADRQTGRDYTGPGTSTSQRGAQPRECASQRGVMVTVS